MDGSSTYTCPFYQVNRYNFYFFPCFLICFPSFHYNIVSQFQSTATLTLPLFLPLVTWFQFSVPPIVWSFSLSHTVLLFSCFIYPPCSSVIYTNPFPILWHLLPSLSTIWLCIMARDDSHMCFSWGLKEIISGHIQHWCLWLRYFC